MTRNSSIESRADSLIEILAAQCADLESLLALSRREAAAIEKLDFEDIMRVVGERATLGERLEIYHRQIAEMRMLMGEKGEQATRSELARQAVKLITDIQAQDARTRPLLVAAHGEMIAAISRLDRTRRGVTAYLRDGSRRQGSIACDQRV